MSRWLTNQLHQRGKTKVDIKINFEASGNQDLLDALLGLGYSGVEAASMIKVAHGNTIQEQLASVLGG